MYVCMSFKLGDRETLHLGQKRIGTYFQINTGNLVLLNLTWENRNGASCKFHESEEHPRRHGSWWVLPSQILKDSTLSISYFWHQNPSVSAKRFPVIFTTKILYLIIFLNYAYFIILRIMENNQVKYYILDYSQESIFQEYVYQKISNSFKS